MFFAPAVLAAGFFATPSQAHDDVVASVSLPPIIVDTGTVRVVVGQPLPPPPPPVIVYEPVREQVVVVRPRHEVVRETVVYVDDDDCDRGPPRHAKAWGHKKQKKHKHHDRYDRRDTVAVYRR